jgi:hypothetical protein
VTQHDADGIIILVGDALHLIELFQHILDPGDPWRIDQNHSERILVVVRIDANIAIKFLASTILEESQNGLHGMFLLFYYTKEMYKSTPLFFIDRIKYHSMEASRKIGNL